MAASDSVVRVLLVAGSDSSAGAGIQRDLQVLNDHGVHARCAMTAVTAQTDCSVAAVHQVPEALIAAQIDCALQDELDAIKIGMLGTAGTVHKLASMLHGVGLPLVIDPVLLSSSGATLLDVEGQSALVKELAPQASLLTPNLLEATHLVGRASRPTTELEMRELASEMASLVRCPVLLKGGHASGELAVDWLYSDNTLTALEGPRFATRMRGTGCALSTAIALELGKARSLISACRRAKDYVADLLQGS